MRVRILVLLTSLIFALTASAEELVIRAARVYPGAGAPFTPGAVRVRDGKIVEIARAITAAPGVKVIDLGSGVLLPGLVDAHTSIGIDGGLNESTAEVTPTFRVLDAVDPSARTIREANADGITTIGLVPGTENVIAGLASVVKTAGEPSRRLLVGDRALVVALNTDPATGNSARNRPDSLYNRQPTNRMGVVWILRSSFAGAPSSTTRGSAVLRECLDGRRPVVCISRTDADISAALRLRQEFSLNLVLAGGQEAYKLRGQIASAKVPVLLGPQTTNPGSGPENSETILNPAGALKEAGVVFALTGGKLLDQARLAVRCGLSREAALEAITATPARLLGVDQRVGTLAIGRDADLVALSGDPFELTTSVRWTMTDGVLRSQER